MSKMLKILLQGQGVAQNFLFEITFAREDKIQRKKLKQAIDDYHFLTLTPGTTKWIKSKDPDKVPDENEVKMIDLIDLK